MLGYNVMMDDRKSQIGGQEEKEDEANEVFARKYTKLRPLKTLNLILMLLVTSMVVANAVAPSSFWLDWSKCWERINLEPEYTCFHPVKVAITQAGMFTLAAGTLHAMMGRKAKSASNLSRLALKDIWFTLLFIANLTLIALLYGVQSFVQFRWFGTKLRANETLAELTEWGTERHLYRQRSNINNRQFFDRAYWNVTRTQSDTEREMEVRKALIKTRLVFDPCVVALTLLAILLQAVFLCRTVSALKQSKPSAGNIYAKGQSNRSALVNAYACFWPLGLLKVALVFLPMLTLFLSCYVEYFYGFYAYKGPITFALLSLVCLCHWACYMEKVRFHNGSQKEGEEEEIVQFCKKDCKFSALALIVLGLLYLFLFRMLYHDELYQNVLLTMAGLFASSLLYNLCLLKCHGDEKGGVGKCGGISVKLNFQFQVNVGKNNDVKPEQANSNVGVGQVEEEKEMEKKKPLSL